jgi:hypothetical protein
MSLNENCRGAGRMRDPLEWLQQAIPPDALFNLKAEIEDAFSQAHRISSKEFGPSERWPVYRGLLHSKLEEAFQRSLQDAGLEARQVSTNPKGGTFSLFESEGVALIRANASINCGPPRATKFRCAYATLNEWLSPKQASLFDTTTSTPDNRLCAMLITTLHKRPLILNEPMFMGIGIPHADLTGWRALHSIPDLLALHHDRTVKPAATRTAPINKTIRAAPRLKAKE